MDSYSFIGTIQVEKANARARYNRYNTIAKIFKAIEVFVAVALLSWSSSRLPTVFKLSTEYLYVFLSYLLNQHVVFLVGNVIVVLCYVLSCHSDTHKEIVDQEEFTEESKFSSSSFIKTSDSDPVSYIEETVLEKEPPSLETEEMEQAMLENNNEDKAGFHENEIVKTESEMAAEMAAEMAIKEAAKRIERFKRTQSAKLKREMSMKPKRELRRSATDTRRTPDNGYRDSKVSDSATKGVERLSSEEFQLVVESFILKQQTFFVKQENNYNLIEY